MKKRLIVVGGGAAGFFGAIRAKEMNPQLEVLLLESAVKPLGKVKISGGGRCNVTHACFDVGRLVQYYPRGQRELKGVFSRFGPQETVDWFESHGVRLKTESDGRIFPVTDNSQTIIDCLLGVAQSVGVKIQVKTPVQAILKTNVGYDVITSHQRFQADAILLATGSSRKAYEWTTSLGHTVIEPVPSLFTFNIQDEKLQNLAGISFPSVKGVLEVPGEKAIIQEGPLLITHWGLSGPVVLKLSAWGARVLYHSQYQGKFIVDFSPEIDQESLRQNLIAQKAKTPKRYIENECPLTLPKRFWQSLLVTEEIVPETQWGDVPQKTLNRLSETLKRCVFEIHGKGVFKEEFVTAGGVSLKEIDLKTMESRLAPGLYLAGEIIDVDGLTGGFNFQNAWSTGWIAGESAARTLAN